jgi:hypothetical protein
LEACLPRFCWRLFQEFNADLISSHPNHSAAPKGKSRGRQQQKELLEIKSFG